MLFCAVDLVLLMIACANVALLVLTDLLASWHPAATRAPRAATPLTGILASLAAPLADAGISIFAISTHDTDYVLVKDESLGRAAGALTAAGHRFFEHEP
jgi:hypothetical protein